MLIEDIARELEPEAASTAPAPETGARTPQPRRGHWPKVNEAVTALRRENGLPDTLRPVERDDRIRDWLRAHGFAEWELPSRTALGRYFAAEAVAA